MSTRNWMKQANCADAKEDFTNPDQDVQRILGHKYCQECPVIETCAEFAIRNNQWMGTWGGMTQGERRSLVARQRRLRR